MSNAFASDPFLEAAPQPSGLPERLTSGKRILVKSTRCYVVLRTAEIRWIESAANYVVLHTGRGKHVMRCTLAELDRRLSGNGFFRASRSALVNLDSVQEVQPLKSGKHTLLLQDGTRIPLARGLSQLRAQL